MYSDNLKKIEKEIILLEMQMETSNIDGGDSSYYKKQLNELRRKKEL